MIPYDSRWYIYADIMLDQLNRLLHLGTMRSDQYEMPLGQQRGPAGATTPLNSTNTYLHQFLIY